MLTCLYWRFHQSPGEEREQTKLWFWQKSCSAALSLWSSASMSSLTICLKTLESLVLVKVLSGTQRGISPSLELALVRCIFAIIAFSSFCSERTTRRLDQLFSCNTTWRTTKCVTCLNSGFQFSHEAARDLQEDFIHKLCFFSSVSFNNYYIFTICYIANVLQNLCTLK